MKSKSEKFIAAREAPPMVSSNMWKAVSDYRKDVLQDEVGQGLFRAPGVNVSSSLLGSKTAAGTVSSLSKKAQVFSGDLSGSSSGGSWRGSGGTIRQTPEVYSPLWLNSNLNLPRDRATINAWCRSFFALNPIVQNAISLHSTYPLSKLNIKCKDEKIRDFFEQMIEEIDLMNVCVQIAQEYWTLGEAFVYAELDERNAKWSRLLIQNPDYMVVKRSVVSGEPIISLRPDENLKRICTSNSPWAIQQREQLDQSIIEHVKRGENIPLSNFYVSHLARRISPYEARGTSLIVSVFKQLMLFDKLRECKFAQADNLINPITLVKIGGGADNYKPTPADIEAYREVFEQCQFDKDFKIFTHDGVSIERVGAGQGIYDTSNDVTQIIKELYIGLMAPNVIMDGGGDVTYANGGVALDVLRQRYMQFREVISKWLRRRIFAPISKMNEFYEYKDGKRVLIVPDVEWNHMSLFDMGDYISNLINLAQSTQPGSAKISLQTVYKSLGLEYEDELRKIKTETIDMVIQQKELETLQQMSLNDLRALGPDDEIPETTHSPLPGENPNVQGTPGGAGGGLPGMPPMGPEGGLGIPSPPMEMPGAAPTSEAPPLG